MAHSRTTLRCTLALATALILAVPATAVAGDRWFGFGFTGALGIYKGASGDPTFAFDGGIEFRLFPTERFSFDINLDVGESVMAPQARCFFHFHGGDSRDEVYFSAGPFFSVQGTPTDQVVMEGGAAGIGGRFGAELVNDSGLFAMGLYARPAIYYTKNPGAGVGSPEYAYFEMVFDITWIIYPPEP